MVQKERALLPLPFLRIDGSYGGTEDDAILSAAATLAKDAVLHFQFSKFAECVEVLNQLLLKKQDDPRVNLVSLALAFALIQIFISFFLELGFAWRCRFGMDRVIGY